MKILLDENVNGYYAKLKELGFDVYLISEMKKTEEKLGHDFNVINFAKDNKMILITKDGETGRACEANGFPCVFINDETIFHKMILVDLQKFESLESSN